MRNINPRVSFVVHSGRRQNKPPQPCPAHHSHTAYSIILSFSTFYVLRISFHFLCSLSILICFFSFLSLFYFEENFLSSSVKFPPQISPFFPLQFEFKIFFTFSWIGIIVPFVVYAFQFFP